MNGDAGFRLELYRSFSKMDSLALQRSQNFKELQELREQVASAACGCMCVHSI